MFIGKEKDALTAIEGPFDNRRSIGGSTDNTTIATTESFEISSRVYIGNRNNASVIPKHIRQHLPALLNLGNIRHIGHRTTCSRIGQNDFLLWSAQDIGSFGHEVNATEDNIIGFRSRGCELGQFER